MDRRITVVIPAYNERSRLPPTLTEIEVFCMKNEIVDEVIVVDDASKDQTAERAQYFLSRIPEFKVLRHRENKGKWAAIRTGIQEAKNDAVLLLDADGSADIWQLEKMMDRSVIELMGTSVSTLDFAMSTKASVFGTRFHKESEVIAKGFIRRMISRVYATFVRIAYAFAKKEAGRVWYIDDMQCPFKLIHKSCINGELETDSFAGDIELACRLEGMIVNHPIRFIHKSGSTVKAQTAYEMFKQTLNIAMEFRKEHKGERNQSNTDVQTY